MSAVPLPRSEGEPEPVDPAALDALRRRLDDQAVQARKTAAQVTQLADSIAALVELGRKRTRWLNLNSFVAYVVFTVLCGGAFYFLYQSRARELAATRDHLAGERDAAVRRADEATAKTAARDAADAKAWDAYQALLAGNRDEAAKKVAELQSAPLSRFDREVLAERAKQAQSMQIDAAMKTATAAFKAGKFGEVAAPLEHVLAADPSGPHAGELHYLAGVALAKNGELDRSITHLQAAAATDATDEDVRFQLAAALDRAGQWGKARGEYDRFATAHPQSPFAVFAMRRSATLARMPAVAPPPGATPPAPAVAHPVVPAAPAPEPAADDKKAEPAAPAAESP